jgi:hypothetical protein
VILLRRGVPVLGFLSVHRRGALMDKSGRHRPSPTEFECLRKQAVIRFTQNAWGQTRSKRGEKHGWSAVFGQVYARDQGKRSAYRTVDPAIASYQPQTARKGSEDRAGVEEN